MILGVIFSHDSAVVSSSTIQQHNVNSMMVMVQEVNHHHERQNLRGEKNNYNDNNNGHNYLENKQFPTHEDENDEEAESMSSCLLTMDDNHFLVEWIAYHYYVCRLRHLIVAIDPRSSRELPTEIFDRWSEFGLTIEVWDDPNTYLFDDYEKRVVERGDKNWDMELLSDPQLSRHRERQSEFYFSCIKSLKRQNRGWTFLIDTDEYLYVNPAIRDPDNEDLHERRSTLQ